MHLKSCPKLVRSELHLEASSVQQSSLFVSQQGALLRTCNSNHGNSGRLPLSIISTNTLRRSSTAIHSSGSSMAPLRLKASPGTPPQPLNQTGCENDTLILYHATPDHADPTTDIWTVIKPGHVREKIAMFAAEGQRVEGVPASSSVSRDKTPSVSQSSSLTGLIRAVKAKGSWEENSSAKRRRRSGNIQNHRDRVVDAQQLASVVSLSVSQQSGDDKRRVGQEVSANDDREKEGGGQKVSVVEMVAFLEQRANEQQPNSKPVLPLQRSSASITLSRVPPLERRENTEAQGEQTTESVKVSDMVAKLESKCLRRRTEEGLSRNNSLRRTESGQSQSSNLRTDDSQSQSSNQGTKEGGLSRSSSLTRTVGRVLLVTTERRSGSCQPASSLVRAPPPSSSSTDREPISCSETPALSLTATPPSGEAESAIPVSQREAPPFTQPQCEGAEPLPGLLFLPPKRILPLSDHAPPLSGYRHSDCRSTCKLKPRPPGPSSDSDSQSEEVKRADQEHVGGSVPCWAPPLGRSASASQDFLLIRQRLQQLLEPQPYLSVLPHHLLVKIFLLLPTQSLAALKCTCHYFAFIIDTYGVRPADSLWVSDPRYRDDPCKQCKKRYGRGDVSLCRWHHKPYCQALPYGPGYWMCCHGARRDTPGCNVGLHDNRWVPVFHSINVPIYRRGRHDN
ncbi:F-box only protein 34-like [Xyrichtys novacula]|uniref:F-box only protein 34-like n=1 Tax=Xyrichtys novacula TaxID=13765 RepID=A0AAV1GNA0_XYRNO|nr:F-box only protein 34-like [Xyrichtys novacula]